MPQATHGDFGGSGIYIRRDDEFFGQTDFPQITFQWITVEMWNFPIVIEFSIGDGGRGVIVFFPMRGEQPKHVVVHLIMGGASCVAVVLFHVRHDFVETDGV